MVGSGTVIAAKVEEVVDRICCVEQGAVSG
jgi:hypothetical protein